MYFTDFCIICTLWLVEFFYLRDTSISPSISDICLNVPIYGDTLWPPYCHHHWLWFCLALFFMEAVTTCHVSVFLCLLTIQSGVVISFMCFCSPQKHSSIMVPITLLCNTWLLISHLHSTRGHLSQECCLHFPLAEKGLTPLINVVKVKHNWCWECLRT